MARTYFSCKVSFEKLLENGNQKRVTEEYLVDSLSFTEAEAKNHRGDPPLHHGWVHGNRH